MFRRLGSHDVFLVHMSSEGVNVLLEVSDCRPCCDVVFWAARGLPLPPS